MNHWDDTIDTVDKLLSFSEKTIKPASRATSSAGYIMSLNKGTIKKRAFIAEYAYLSSSDKDNINLFFDDNQGAVFTMKNPDPNYLDETISVLFDQDELDFKYIQVFPGEYSIKISFGEV